jgi:hypothetical protein
LLRRMRTCNTCIFTCRPRTLIARRTMRTGSRALLPALQERAACQGLQGTSKKAERHPVGPAGGEVGRRTHHDALWPLDAACFQRSHPLAQPANLAGIVRRHQLAGLGRAVGEAVWAVWAPHACAPHTRALLVPLV